MQGLAPFWLDRRDQSYSFPSVQYALREPDGLLAIGGDLSPERLITAYRQGIFPWYNEGQPILWWAPDPRMVLFPDQLRISRSLRKTLRKNLFTVTADTAFSEVIEACSGPRRDHQGTWITSDMKQAYNRLHQLGYAHSIECWQDGELVGGLYGVAVGEVFFGESMFSHRTDASKVAFVRMVEQLKAWGFALIDCQIYSTHLESLGATTIPRDNFCDLLAEYCDQGRPAGKWQFPDAESVQVNA